MTQNLFLALTFNYTIIITPITATITNTTTIIRIIIIIIIIIIKIILIITIVIIIALPCVFATERARLVRANITFSESTLLREKLRCSFWY